MIQGLGLEKVGDNVVGTVLKRGLSGGEKRRTSVGQELVVKQALAFLDEPTSGLDGTAAHDVIKVKTGVNNHASMFLQEKALHLHIIIDAVHTRYEKLIPSTSTNVVPRGRAAVSDTTFSTNLCTCTVCTVCHAVVRRPSKTSLGEVKGISL